VRTRVYAKIPTQVTLHGEAGVGACPGARDASQESARTALKKHHQFRPLLSVATICLLPVALHAQTTDAASQQPARASTPSMPSTPSLPSAPSQPASLGDPNGNLWYPGGAAGFQPAGTQASTVSETTPALQLRAMAGIERESNALRTAGGGSSDTDYYAGVGLRADRSYGRQRLRADLEANTYRYDKDTSLNYSVFNYALAWDWAVGSRLHGVASADQHQYREVAIDPVTFGNRLGKRTERSDVLEGVYDLGARLRLMAGASRTEAKSTVPNSWDASPVINSARVGAGYELASGSSVWLRYRHGTGHYTDPTPGASTGSFKEDETDAVVKWAATAKTALEASIGHLQRKHDENQFRDFSGMVGSAAVNWDITAKTRLVGGVNRTLGVSGLATGGNVRSDRIYIGPVWKATAQIAVNARYDHVKRDWNDVPTGSPFVGRTETVNVLSAGVDWEPRRWLTVSGYVRNERESQNLNTGYHNTTVGAAVKAYF
jgi:exopolysaccharide biosynthesis operon protein EpsL